MIPRPPVSPNPAVLSKNASGSYLLSRAHHYLPNPLLPSEPFPGISAALSSEV